MRTITRNQLIILFVAFFSIFLFLISTPPKALACLSDAECGGVNFGPNKCCGGNQCNDVYTSWCEPPVDGTGQGICNFNVYLETRGHQDCGGLGCTNGSCNTAPPPVCTPGSYQTSCTGNCGGCPADSGEQSVYQCRGDGSGYDFQYSQCSTACSGPCAPPPASCGDLSCNNGETCSSCSSDCGTCPTPPPGGAYCGDLSCNNGETCSSCPGDCGACTGVSCNTDVVLAVSPNPANVNSTVNFSVVSGDASTFLGDSWTGGVSGCGGAWNSINCTGSASGTFQWSHTWKHCEGSFDNCSSTCSKSINFTINAIIPPAPTVSAPSCIDNGYSGSGVAISWTNTSPPVTYADISTDINFGSYANKAVSGTSTSAPAGFSNSLTLNPGTTYYVRTWNGSQHSITASFSIPVCPPAAPTGLSASCSITGTSVTFSWTPVTGATSYQITVNGTPVFLNPYPISPDTNYLWGVKACNSAGCSSESPGSFICDSSVSPWIQTSGDVHSNEGINVPGGP